VTARTEVFDLLQANPPSSARGLQLVGLAVWDFGEFNKWLKNSTFFLAFVGSIVALLELPQLHSGGATEMQGAPLLELAGAGMQQIRERNIPAVGSSSKNAGNGGGESTSKTSVNRALDA